MKKLIIPAVVALFAASCSTGDNVYEYGPTVQTVNLYAPWNDWNFTGDEYKIDFDMPEITPAVCETGSVVARVVFDNGYQSEMPYVRHYRDAVNPNYTWTVTVNSAFKPGLMTFYAAFSDFVYDPGNNHSTYEPGDWRFRVLITEP